jgi:hypothetical protein
MHRLSFLQASRLVRLQQTSSERPIHRVKRGNPHLGRIALKSDDGVGSVRSLPSHAMFTSLRASRKRTPLCDDVSTRRPSQSYALFFFKRPGYAMP